MIKTRYDSPLGDLTLVSNGAALSALVFEDHSKTSVAVAAARPGEDAVTSEAARQLDAYFSRARRAFDVPIAPEGNAFQRRVWSALQSLAFGETATYGAIARELGVDGAARAVGSAVGRNPISIVIPCHRVIGSSGALTGYAGGVERKRWLLELESVARAA